MTPSSTSVIPWGSGKKIVDGGERGSFLIKSASNQICWVLQKCHSSFPSRSLCMSGHAMIVQARFLPTQGRHFSSFDSAVKSRVNQSPLVGALPIDQRCTGTTDRKSEFIAKRLEEIRVFQQLDGLNWPQMCPSDSSVRAPT
jgi:hypothetical protein